MPVSPEIRKRVVFSLAGAAGAGALLANPDDAEAISANAYWKGAKAAVKHLPRSEQAQVAGALRKVPKTALDSIGSVESGDLVQKVFGPGAQGAHFIGEPSSVLLAKSTPKSTPVHEALHELYYKMLPGDREALKNYYKTIPSKVLNTLSESVGNVHLGNEKELLAEVGSQALMNDPKIISKIPSDHLAKILTIIEKYKKPLFGALATTGGLAYLSQSSDAEAAPKMKIPNSWPPQKFVKEGAQKVIGKYAQSSSMESMVEKGIQVQGKTLTGVYRGPGRWRYLTFSDGSMMPTDKDHVRSLVRDFGAQEYTNFMKKRPEKVQVYQAKRSAEARYGQAVTNELSPDEIRDLMGRYISNVEKLTPETMPATRKVLVQYKGKTFQMPREYAERMQESKIPKFRILNEFQKKPGGD